MSSATAMKTLLISTSDLDGGAARSCFRLHQGLQQIGVNANLLVQDKRSGNHQVIATRSSYGIGQAKSSLRLTLDRLPLKLYPNRTTAAYSTQWLPDNISQYVAQINPEIVNLHWVNSGYLQIESMRQIAKPIVWTLHDMWSFTGGCHYDQGCDRYTKNCGQCPQLGSTQQQDLSRWTWQRKATAWKRINLTIVAPSRWLADCAKRSALFQDRRVEYIPYSINTDIYRPINRDLARQILGLPQNKFLILSGSLGGIQDNRKGFHLLQAALQRLSQTDWCSKLELVVFGSTKPENPPELGLATHYLGSFNDDISLALVYSAADVFIAPSQQDNLPNTVLEAIACGTPCVAFKIGGLPDMIEHHQNGYLASPYDSDDLARGIAWILEDSARYTQLAERARQKAEQEFALDIQPRRYLALFESLLVSQAISHSNIAPLPT
jgi:glycosyltransferase involved in cell wall biosynthesis